MVIGLGREKVLRSLFCAIAFLFPIGIGVVSHWGSGLMFVALLISLVGLGRNWAFPQGLERYILIAFALFFLVTALGLIDTVDLKAGTRRLEKMLCLLYAIPLYLFMKREKLDLTKPLLYGCLLAGPFLATAAIYFVHGQGVGRADGHYSAIIFGQLSILVAVLTLTGLWCGRFLGFYRFFAVVSLMCGLYASLLSGTRGAMIAFPVALFFLLVARRPTLSWWKVLIFVTFAITFFAVADVKDQTSKRFGLIKAQVKQFRSGENIDTSVGVRLVLWQDSFHLWIKEPLLGVGLGSFYYAHKDSMERQNIQLKRIHTHPHNIFLDTLASTGLLGFIGLVGGVFVLPTMFFWRCALARKENGRSFAPIAGTLLLVCYAVFGLTEGWTLHMVSMVVLSFLLTLFMAAAALNTVDSKC